MGEQLMRGKAAGKWGSSRSSYRPSHAPAIMTMMKVSMSLSDGENNEKEEKEQLIR